MNAELVGYYLELLLDDVEEDGEDLDWADLLARDGNDVLHRAEMYLGMVHQSDESDRADHCARCLLLSRQHNCAGKPVKAPSALCPFGTCMHRKELSGSGDATIRFWDLGRGGGYAFTGHTSLTGYTAVVTVTIAN